jgi:hypothetical protein
MSARQEIRVSDRERQAAVDRLRAALDEGRLDFLEYDRRLLLAYQAITYGDLDQLFVDLPGTALARIAPSEPRKAVEAAVTPMLSRPVPVPNPPLILKILWINWVVVVVINLTVWLAVPEAGYFRPAWMAVPGVLLLGAAAGVNAIRNRRSAIDPGTR